MPSKTSIQLKAMLQHALAYVDSLENDPDLGEHTRLEGHLWLTEILSSVNEQFLNADPLHPVFQVYNTPFRRILGDQIDNHANYVARISADQTYRVTFTPGSAPFYSMSVYGGEEEGQFSTYIVGRLNNEEMQKNADGSIEIILSKSKHPGNWIKLEDTTMSICTREYFHDNYFERIEGRWYIERLGKAAPPPRLTDDALAEKLRLANLNLRVNTTMSPLPQATGLFTTQTGVNEFAPLKRLTTKVAMGWSNSDAVHATLGYQLQPDEALVIDGEAPPPVDWWGLNQNNEYLQSFNGLTERVAITGDAIVMNSDGGWRVVLSSQNPGVDNWLSTAGRTHGFLRIRWLNAKGDPVVPRVQLVKVSSLAAGA